MLSIYARELLAVQLGLFQFRSPLRGRTVVVFCDDSTAVHSLRKGGAPGLLSSTPWLRRSCARWSPSPSACLPSSFRAPTRSLPTPCLALTSSHIRLVFTHDRLSVFEKTVAGSNVFFATSATHRGSIYFSPFRDPWSAGTDAFLQIWDSLRAYAFPPVAVIRVLSRSSGHPRGRDLLLWLSTGLSALSFRTWSSSRWLLQWSYRPVYTSCSWLGLVISTRISVGSGFMPGASPALSKSSWLLLRYRGAVCTGAPSILARSVSGTLVHLSWVVSLQWPFHL